MSAYSALVLAHANLQAYWRMGEASGTTLADSKGTNTGTLAATGIIYGTTPGLTGDANKALTFDASTNPATVPDATALDLSDGPLTLELWVKRATTGGAATLTLLNKGATGGSAHELTFATDDTLRFGVSPNAVANPIARTGAINDTTTWHHVVVTKNGATTKMYLDGVDVTVAGTNQTLGDSTNVLRIGHFSAAGVGRFPGSMDELAIYKEVLSAADVAQHYKVGKGIIDQASTVNTAQTLSVAKQKALAQTTEADLAQLIAAGQSFPVGQASEMDSAQPVGAPKVVAVGQASEADEAQAITFGAVVVSPGGAFDVVPIRRRPKPKTVLVLGAQETDLAFPLDATQTPSRIQIEDDELLLLV